MADAFRLRADGLHGQAQGLVAHLQDAAPVVDICRTRQVDAAKTGFVGRLGGLSV
jgi:hypothetical protein